jgi:hypothetical protein
VLIFFYGTCFIVVLKGDKHSQFVGGVTNNLQLLMDRRSESGFFYNGSAVYSQLYVWVVCYLI